MKSRLNHRTSLILKLILMICLSYWEGKVIVMLYPRPTLTITLPMAVQIHLVSPAPGHGYLHWQFFATSGSSKTRSYVWSMWNFFHYQGLFLHFLHCSRISSISESIKWSSLFYRLFQQTDGTSVWGDLYSPVESFIYWRFWGVGPP